MEIIPGMCVHDNAGGGGWDTGNKGPFHSIFIFQVDTTSPEVVSVDPPHGATGVSLDSNVTATFDDAIDTWYLQHVYVPSI